MLDAYDREILNADEEESYDFSHLPEVIEYVLLLPHFLKLTDHLKACPPTPRLRVFYII
jgi:hypothetical protein